MWDPASFRVLGARLLQWLARGVLAPSCEVTASIPIGAFTPHTNYYSLLTAALMFPSLRFDVDLDESDLRDLVEEYKKVWICHRFQMSDDR